MLRQPYDYHTAVPKQNLPILARRFTALSTISNRFATSAITEYKAGTPIPSAASGGADGTFNIAGTGGVTLEVTTNAEGAAAIAANPVGSVFALTMATVPALSGSDQVGLSGTFGGAAYAGTTIPATVTAGKTYFAEVIAVASTTNGNIYFSFWVYCA